MSESESENSPVSGQPATCNLQPATGSVPSVASCSFSIPAADTAYFASLPDQVRADVRRKLTALKSIAVAPKIMPACKAQAALMHGARGFSAATLRSQYYTYAKTGDWRLLIDHARAGKDFIDRGASQDLPGEFIEYWRGLCERNQRKSRAARRELLHIWRTHHDTAGRAVKSIPGYNLSTRPSALATSSWPAADPSTGIPAGWSEANLYRFAPTKFELTAARIGRAAAAGFRPQVLSTRVGLRVGQYLVFDDQEYDVKVNFPGNSKAMRPLGLNALDLFSACLFAYSFKPTIWNAEAEAKQKLKEVDMLWFAVHVLTSFGYRDDDGGTTLVVEHGTAAIREDFEQRIFDATHGKVRVDRSGIGGAPSFDGLFEGASRGNFRFKAALESIFNLVRNEMAMLPGNVGKDRLHSPEELHGRDRYNNSLIRAGLALPPERSKLLRLPFLDWQQFTGLCLDLYSRINSRVDHDLEGWERAGLVASEWRLPLSSTCNLQPATCNQDAFTPWMDQQKFLALPAPEQAIMRQLIEAQPSLTRARKLAPVEVFQRGQPELQRVPSFLLPVLLGPEFGIERRAKNGIFEFEDRAISPDPIRFLARLSSGELVADGEKFLTYLNPFSPTELIVCNTQGGYLGTCLPWASPCRSDTEAIHRQMGQAKHIEAQLLAPVARRGAEVAREKLEMHRHNASILAAGNDPRGTSVKIPESLRQQITPADLAAATEGVGTSPSPRQFSPEEISNLFTDLAPQIASPLGEGQGEGDGCSDS